jgi:hypothetical protein
MVLQLTDSP